MIRTHIWCGPLMTKKCQFLADFSPIHNFKILRTFDTQYNTEIERIKFPLTDQKSFLNETKIPGFFGYCTFG